MPRIDPQKLLTCLSVLLAPNGGIRSSEEVKRLAGLMEKFSKKLVSKCIYIQICKSTETELLGQFMAAGGWSLTHSWLSDGILTQNWPLVRELLELLLLCPVDVARLKSNSAPKLVKQLSKEGSQENVRILATKLVEQWLKIVKGETMAVDKPKIEINSVDPNITNTVNNNNNKVIINKLSKNSALTVSSNKTNSVFLNENTQLQVKENENIQEKDPLAIDNNDEVHASIQNDNVENSQNLEKLSDSQSLVSKNNQKNDSSDDNLDKKSYDNDNNNTVEHKSTKEEKSEKDKVEKDKETIDKEKSSSKDKEKDRDKLREKDRHRDKKSSSSSSHKSSHRSGSSGKSTSHSSSSKSSSSHKSSSSSKQSSSSSHSSSHKDKDKNRSSSSSKSSSSSSKDKSKEKDKDEKMQAEKDKDTLAKVTPQSINKLGKIPKKSKDTDTGDSSSNASGAATPPQKKTASISIEVRKDVENRPKTVKTFNSQFRSHGLAEEAPPPPPRKGLKKPPSTPAPGISIPPVMPVKRSSPPPKETVVEKKLKLDIPVVEKPGAIKLIAPKPKPALLVESDMFMDALSASAPVVKKEAKKRKRRTSSSSKDNLNNSITSPPTSPGTPQTPVTPTSPKVVAAPLKFYQDTLDDQEEKNEKKDNADDSSKEKTDEESKTEISVENDEDEDDIPLKRLKDSGHIDTPKDKSNTETEATLEEQPDRDAGLLEATDEPKQPGAGTGPNGPPGVLVIHRRRGPKKQLKWRPQESLEEIRFFELDETERVNVTKTFTDAKQMERCQEREFVQTVRNKFQGIDRMYKEIEWMPLIEIEDIPELPQGNLSNEKKIQNEREQTVLKVLYFSPHSIPDSPAEPDMESYKFTEPQVIPLDDITGNPDAVMDLTNMPWPEGKGEVPNTPSAMNIPPFNAPPYMPMDLQRPPWPMQQNGPMMRMPMDCPPQFNGPNNFNGMPSNPNFQMNMMNNIMGPMKMKDVMPNMNMNMRGPSNGNWFRPGGPPPNWMNKNNSDRNGGGGGGGGGGGRGGGGGYNNNNHGRGNWTNNRGHNRGYGGGGGYKNSKNY